MGRVYSSSKVNIGRECEDTSLASADDKLHAPPPVFTTELKHLKIKLGDTFTLGCQGKMPMFLSGIVFLEKKVLLDTIQNFYCLFLCFTNLLVIKKNLKFSFVCCTIL